MLKRQIEHLLDIIYPLFSKLMDKTTFRYAACGGSNTVFDLFLFFIFYNFVLQKQNGSFFVCDGKSTYCLLSFGFCC